MTTVADFFSMPEADVQRGEGGSPMLVPKGLEGKGIRAPYTRASYMADFVEDKHHIHRWEMRYLAKAMGQNEDLAALAACETYSTGISDATKGREKTASGRRLDEIIERAFDRVRLHEKADRGTAVHGFTEPGAPSGEAIPERLRSVVSSFWQTLKEEAIEIVATEQFTANDITMSAGTFDHLVRVPGHPDVNGTYVIADKKTGNYEPFEWAIQLSSYAYGEPYDTSTDTRPAWPGRINKEWGLIFHMDAEAGTTTLRWVDLAFGWRMAQIAAQVRDAHKQTDICMDYRRTPMHIRVGLIDNKDDLTRLWWSTEDPGLRGLIEEKARSL